MISFLKMLIFLQTVIITGKICRTSFSLFRPAAINLKKEIRKQRRLLHRISFAIMRHIITVLPLMALQRQCGAFELSEMFINYDLKRCFMKRNLILDKYSLNIW